MYSECSRTRSGVSHSFFWPGPRHTLTLPTRPMVGATSKLVSATLPLGLYSGGSFGRCAGLSGGRGGAGKSSGALSGRS